MTITINKIKTVFKFTQPKFNEKYNVWVVRVKTDKVWKVIRRKDKDQSIKIFEKMSKVFDKTSKDKDSWNSGKVAGWNECYFWILNLLKEK